MSDYAVDPLDIKTLSSQLLKVMRRTDHHGHWLALIDTAFDHELDGLYWNKPIHPVYRQGKLEQFRHVSPVLVEIDTTRDAAMETELKRLLHHCQGRPMLSFLHACVSLESLIGTWQRILEIQTEDGQLLLLRFADSRTLPTIATVMKESTWPVLTQGIDQWHCIDRDGRLQTLTIPDAGLKPGDSSIRISDAELAEFSRLSLPDALANALRENFTDLLPSVAAADHRKLSVICALAEKNGIDGFPDIMGLAVVIYAYGESLAKNAELSAWLGKHEWQDGQFMDALVAHVESLEETTP